MEITRESKKASYLGRCGRRGRGRSGVNRYRRGNGFARPGSVERSYGQHEVRRLRPGDQALSGTDADSRGAGIDEDGEYIGPDVVLRLRQRRPQLRGSAADAADA